VFGRVAVAVAVVAVAGWQWFLFFMITSVFEWTYIVFLFFLFFSPLNTHDSLNTDPIRMKIPPK
jgi:hypothetical protein